MTRFALQKWQDSSHDSEYRSFHQVTKISPDCAASEQLHTLIALKRLTQMLDWTRSALHDVGFRYSGGSYRTNVRPPPTGLRPRKRLCRTLLPNASSASAIQLDNGAIEADSSRMQTSGTHALSDYCVLFVIHDCAVVQIALSRLINHTIKHTSKGNSRRLARLFIAS